jgi:hypothetical protein
LDVKPVLEPSLTNYYDYVHYTPTGAGVVARAVATALRAAPGPSRPILPPPSRQPAALTGPAPA